MICVCVARVRGVLDLLSFAYLETRWQALSGSGGSSPGGVFSCVVDSRAGRWAGGRSFNACREAIVMHACQISLNLPPWGFRMKFGFGEIDPQPAQLGQAGRCRAFVGVYTGFSASLLSARKSTIRLLPGPRHALSGQLTVSPTMSSMRAF